MTAVSVVSVFSTVVIWVSITTGPPAAAVFSTVTTELPSVLEELGAAAIRLLIVQALSLELSLEFSSLFFSSSDSC